MLNRHFVLPVELFQKKSLVAILLNHKQIGSWDFSLYFFQTISFYFQMSSKNDHNFFWNK